jgi:hypothetical protein
LRANKQKKKHSTFRSWNNCYVLYCTSFRYVFLQAQRYLNYRFPSHGLTLLLYIPVFKKISTLLLWWWSLFFLVLFDIWIFHFWLLKDHFFLRFEVSFFAYIYIYIYISYEWMNEWTKERRDGRAFLFFSSQNTKPALSFSHGRKKINGFFPRSVFKYCIIPTVQHAQLNFVRQKKLETFFPCSVLVYFNTYNNSK